MKYKNIVVSRFRIRSACRWNCIEEDVNCFGIRSTTEIRGLLLRWNKISFWSKFLYPTFIGKTFIIEPRACNLAVKSIEYIRRIPENITKPLFVWLNVVDLIRMYLPRLDQTVDGTIRNRRKFHEPRWNYSPFL